MKQALNDSPFEVLIEPLLFRHTNRGMLKLNRGGVNNTGAIPLSLLYTKAEWNSMNWYNLKEASAATGKTDRTIRNYLSKWKLDNPNKFTHKKIYKYEANQKGIEKLYVSATFLQTYFSLNDSPPERTPERTTETSPEFTAVNNGGIQLDINEFEEKLTKREELLREHFQKEFDRLEKVTNELVDSKQQMIESLKNDKDQLNKDKDSLNYNLNKVLENNSQQQMTIENLLRPNREPLPIDNDITDQIYIEQETKDIQEDIKESPSTVVDIITEQQKPTGLRTNAEYFADKEGYTIKRDDGEIDTPKDFTYWLKNRKED